MSVKELLRLLLWDTAICIIIVVILVKMMLVVSSLFPAIPADGLYWLVLVVTDGRAIVVAAFELVLAACIVLIGVWYIFGWVYFFRPPRRV